MFALDQSSDARVDGRPFHVPVLQAEQPQLTVSDTELAFVAGARGVLFSAQSQWKRLKGHDPNVSGVFRSRA